VSEVDGDNEDDIDSDCVGEAVEAGVSVEDPWRSTEGDVD
jgi:hypothetical protein